jgi:hypothetical protein
LLTTGRDRSTAFWQPLVTCTQPLLTCTTARCLRSTLLPADQRSKVFYVGNWEFNPETVGFVSDVRSKEPPCSTSLPGNSDAEDEYGTDLNEDDRKALIEYLKIL